MRIKIKNNIESGAFSVVGRGRGFLLCLMARACEKTAVIHVQSRWLLTKSETTFDNPKRAKCNNL